MLRRTIPALGLLALLLANGSQETRAFVQEKEQHGAPASRRKVACRSWKRI